jgi:hypothetical protein
VRGAQGTRAVRCTLSVAPPAAPPFASNDRSTAMRLQTSLFVPLASQVHCQAQHMLCFSSASATHTLLLKCKCNTCSASQVQAQHMLCPTRITRAVPLSNQSRSSSSFNCTFIMAALQWCDVHTHLRVDKQTHTTLVTTGIPRRSGERNPVLHDATRASHHGRRRKQQLAAMTSLSTACREHPVVLLHRQPRPTAPAWRQYRQQQKRCCRSTSRTNHPQEWTNTARPAAWWCVASLARCIILPLQTVSCVERTFVTHLIASHIILFYS